MSSTVKLKKDAYNSAKLSVISGSLYGKEKIRELATQSFDEILIYLEENGFRNSVDKSYLQYEGFYLVERILNDHISEIYTKIFGGCSKHNKILLDTYYLKYQIHNLLAVFRCKLANEKELETYLIGDSKKKLKYIKAFEMPVQEDALIYLAKKLNLDVKQCTEQFKKGLYDLENYLYKTYYTKLNELNVKYNRKDEKLFSEYIHQHIDLLNVRTFLKLLSEKIETEKELEKGEPTPELNFKEFYIEGGKLKLELFENLQNETFETAIEKFTKHFSNIKEYNINTFQNLDKQILDLKNSTNQFFKKIKFGSPFYSLKFLFKVEKEMTQLRTLLKAKHVGLSQEKIMELL